MKSTERHHLKQDELGAQVARAREIVDARRNEVTAAVTAVVVIGALVIGFFGWREHTRNQSSSLLAEAMSVADARIGPPAAPGTPNPGLSFPTEQERAQAAVVKFKAAADAYPTTDQGLFARYQQATLLATLGKADEAQKAYQDVIGKGGETLYAQMGKLGLAESQARAGQFDQAITIYRELSQRKDGPLPVDGILMQLARTYRSAGKTSDAQQTLGRIVQEYPESAYSGEAKREMDALKKTT